MFSFLEDPSYLPEEPPSLAVRLAKFFVAFCVIVTLGMIFTAVVVLG